MIWLSLYRERFMGNSPMAIVPENSTHNWSCFRGCLPDEGTVGRQAGTLHRWTNGAYLLGFQRLPESPTKHHDPT
jgi:hypothetical protein